MITESLRTSKHLLQEEKFDKFLDIERYFYTHLTNEQDKTNSDLQYGVNCHDSPILPNNGKILLLVLCVYNLLPNNA